MSEQKLQPFGLVLWLHFNLLLDVIDSTGNIVTTIKQLSETINVPQKLIKSALDKLERYRLIDITQLNTKYYLINLKYFNQS